MMPLKRVCSSRLFLACQNPYAFMRALARMKAAPLQSPWPEGADRAHRNAGEELMHYGNWHAHSTYRSGGCRFPAK
jgi:hypothetical protein